MTGWNLPPGCTDRMIDEALGVDEPCDCCGHHVDECVCPECPYCGATGDPKCYDEGHHSDDVRLGDKMEYTLEQRIGQQKMRIAELETRLNDERYALQLLEEKLVQADYGCSTRTADFGDTF